ncbi:MAG TPA: aminotransferase class V-fold PLP-dependent enzyme [Beijerinckiaceae bacterium]|jgi:selenocysteine lyase/cysteine desulfurase
MLQVHRAVPLDLSAAFARFSGTDPERLHFAAHSHHLWPDVTRDAQIQAWDDAARLIDDKWDEVLGRVWRDCARGIAGHLGLPDPSSLVPAPNTHELVNRLLSACPADRPPRVVATDGEFHSFRRQSERLAEDGLIELRLVPAEPFGTLVERLEEACRDGADLVFASQVLFGSGYAVADLNALVAAVWAPGRLVVIDGYHGFLARPTDLSAVADKAFYLAGGYKYAMAGEGACFLHCPPEVAPRPRNTGWYASFGTLSGQQAGVPYAADGWRFMGATFDPSGLYRLRAALAWLAEEGLGAALIHAHAVALQERFMAAMAERPLGPFAPENLVVPLSEPARGNFLAFRHTEAAAWQRRLHEAKIVTDVRGDRLRLGFGLYHRAEDVDRLVERLRGLA